MHHDDRFAFDYFVSGVPIHILVTAFDLDLFEKIANHVNTIPDLVTAYQIDPRSIEVMIYSLIAMELLYMKDNALYLSPSTEKYLLSSSEYNWKPLLLLRKDATSEKIKKYLTIKPAWYSKLWQAHRVDKLLSKLLKISPQFKHFPLIGLFKNFSLAMHGNIYEPSKAAINTGIFAQTECLLDVGGGFGSFAMAFLTRYPDRVAGIFDLHTVGMLAQDFLKEQHFDTKINIHSGNFFVDKFPSTYDGMILSNIFHDWNPQQCKHIAANIFNALPSGGKIFLQEMLLNDDRTSPKSVVLMDFLMHIHHHAQQFTQQDLVDLLQAVGFQDISCSPTIGYYSIICGHKK
ncbi:MAG: hypothetical protein K2Q33_09170 [Gammaproteobacteria bacterium]|nr:hypothetical protein [Gammaproteobacteria bacterium]